jgi:hypothetical protein
MTDQDFIRVLWGDSRPGCRRNKVWRRDVKWARQRAEAPYTVWCYGQENADDLTKAGISCEMVDREPFPDGFIDKDLANGSTLPWHNKHQLIAAAAGGRRVIYCDWDVQIRCRSQDEAFDAMGDRRLALTAYYYLKPRHAERDSRRSQRISIGGNWIYCVGDSFPKAIGEIMHDAGKPRTTVGFHDEHAMVEYVERENGGWPSEERWLERYESPIMMQKPCKCPWGDRETLPIEFTWTPLFAQGIAAIPR